MANNVRNRHELPETRGRRAMSEGDGGFSRRLLPRLFIAQKKRPGHLGEIDLEAL